jgi:hypothetical protein
MTTTKFDCDFLVNFLSSNFLNSPPLNIQTVKSIHCEDVFHVSSTIDCNYDRPHVLGIYVYPIKSCSGIDPSCIKHPLIFIAAVKVSRWPLCDSGLFLDREWAVINTVTGKVVTQKSHPKLSSCQPSIDVLTGKILVRSPYISTILAISITLDDENSCSTPNILICDAKREAVETPSGLSHSEDFDYDGGSWFSTLLGESCKLVRRKFLAQLPDEKGGKLQNFSNEGQFLVITEASLLLLSKVISISFPI